MNFKLKKKRILIALSIGFALTTLALLYLFVKNPIVHETFTLASSEKATEELNLTGGEYVFIWLSSIPKGMSGRSAQQYVIRFYVTSPDNTSVLDQSIGIASTGLFNPLTLMAQHDGVYTMHFDNSVGGSFDKIVSLYYKIAISALGVPVELLLFFSLLTILALVIALVILMLIERGKATHATSQTETL